MLILGILWLAATAWVRRREARAGRASSLSADILAGGLLYLLIVGFFWRTLSGDVYQPADGGDLLSFLFPTYRFAAGELAQGLRSMAAHPSLPMCRRVISTCPT